MSCSSSDSEADDEGSEGGGDENMDGGGGGGGGGGGCSDEEGEDEDEDMDGGGGGGGGSDGEGEDEDEDAPPPPGRKNVRGPDKKPRRKMSEKTKRELENLRRWKKRWTWLVETFKQAKGRRCFSKCGRNQSTCRLTALMKIMKACLWCKCKEEGEDVVIDFEEEDEAGGEDEEMSEKEPQAEC
uniref:Uncharacterized protein n=1 Tax=Chromera velia CCMP2878 TaxID=1169474 RepID=A0A0G4G138_9ALVE|eukprot:Cvel_4036.t1-p1 / transcript=Cvel_4036.t1 / gene=Cvel_4036 / organism=Chromera_velia_CCMP2878 / gene_product=hypothetical protein / transcript_product=hypothetical protein / location=Cvel_scaffold171:103258-103806(-) / protein_length=183 / sequence_SO=supercontig / SO=protein_coding / is_pseudo=false